MSYARTSDKNIFRLPVTVYKDENGLYPNGCKQKINCNDAIKVGGPVNLVLDIQSQGANGCVERIYPSQDMGISGVSDHITVQAINVRGRGLVYIYPSDYTQLVNNCSGCCGPIVS